MKLFELVGIKKFDGLTRNEILKLATADGKFGSLGSGIASHVVEYNGNAYKFWFVDDGYEAYVKLARSSNNPYYPKFLSDVKTIKADFIKKHKSAPDVIKYVKMEKLKVQPESSTITGQIKIGDGLTIDLSRAFYFARYIIEPYSVKIINNKNWLARCLLYAAQNPDKHPSGGMDAGEDEVSINLFNTTGKQLVEALIEITELGKSIGQVLDTNKNENFGLRGNQFVFLDPFISLSTVSKNLIIKGHEKNIESKKALNDRKKKPYRKRS